MHWQNYIGEPYRVFWSWASDRTIGTEQESLTARRTLTTRGLLLLDAVAQAHGLE
jgi:hypothetical protein